MKRATSRLSASHLRDSRGGRSTRGRRSGRFSPQVDAIPRPCAAKRRPTDRVARPGYIACQTGVRSRRMARLFSRTLGKAGGWSRRQAAQPAAVVSVIIRDGLALSNFFEFCLPSLAGEGGLKSLIRDSRGEFAHIFARNETCPRSSGSLKARNLGCTIAFQPIPEDLAILADGIAGPSGRMACMARCNICI